MSGAGCLSIAASFHNPEIRVWREAVLGAREAVSCSLQQVGYHSSEMEALTGPRALANAGPKSSD